MAADVPDVLERKGEPLAAMAIARGASITDAAREAGVSPRTVRRRLSDPAYRAEVANLRGKILDGILARLLHGAAAGVETLIEVAEAGKSESARVSASRILVEHLLSFAELVGVNDRLAAVEEAMEEARRPKLTYRAEVSPGSRPRSTRLCRRHV